MTVTTAIAVPVERILADADVRWAANYSPGNVSSFTYRQPRILGINSAISPRRQRFALAHAYGHLQLHKPPLLVCRSIRAIPVDAPSGQSAPTAAMEGEADRYAADLLMPEEAVQAELERQAARPHDSRDQLLQRLAARFEVSIEAMGWRLMTLGMICG